MANFWDKDESVKQSSNFWDQDETVGVKKEPEGFASKIKNYGLSTLAALGSGAAELGSGIGTFLEAPAANTLSAVINTGALLDRGYTDLSNAIGKGDPNFEQKKYNQDLQENAQRVSAFAAESRAENVDSKYNVIANTGQFLESGGRSLSHYIDNKIQENLPELVRQQKEISNANGAYDTTVESLKNPLAFSHTLVKSAPSLLLGLGAGRVVAGRVLASGSVLAESAAARVAAAGGDVAAQEAAAKAAIDAVQAQATRAASTAGIGSEAATSGLSSRESSYTQVKQTPFDQLSESPRFNELVKQTGDREKSREILANEVADSTPILSAGLTGLGTVATNKLYGGDATAKVLSGVEKTGLKAVVKDISQEGAEEVIQGVPQGYSDHRAMQLADPNKKFDLGAEIAQNALGGIALGGAGHGAAYAKQKFNDARVGVADPIKNRYENNIEKTLSPDAKIAPSDEVQLTEPEKALANPTVITPLDRVNQIDVNLKKLSPENGYGEVFDQERSDLLNERASILQSFPEVQEGAPTSFTTEDGARLNGRYALIDANDLQTSHDIDLRENPNYPPELQPRERERAASAAQISGIVQKIDPARLGASADAGTGAPIIGADGLVESGNARSIALKRIYRVPGQKAEDYKAYLTANAAQFGIDPVQIEQLQNPVLVRVRDTPVDRAEFARQANAPTVARLSTVEQARADAKRLDVLDDLSPTDSGDFSNSTNFISRFVAKVPQTERGELVDADGKLSAAGYARVRNAVLAKAYGDSPVILRLTESLNDNLRNVSKALLQVAPKVAQVRASIKDGNLHDADITPDLLGAVEELSRIKDSGQSVPEYLNQDDIFGDKTSSESRELLQFLDENIRRPKQIAEFILRYNEALESIGNPKQADIFNDNSTPEKSDLLNLAKRDNNDQPIIEQGRNQESPVPAGQDGVERADQSSDQEGNRGDQAPAGGEGQGVVVDGATDNLDSSKNIGSDAIIGSDNGDQSGSFSSVDLRKKNVSPSENFSKNVPASNSVEEGNGEVKDQTETKNFKKWFSGSKVVDDNGNPLPMYHGTNKNQDGDAFKIFDVYGSNYGLFGNGQYFTDDPYVASSYTDKGKGSSPSVYKVFLSIKNPINMDVEADPNLWKDNFKDVNFDEFEPRSNTNESYYRAVEDYLTSEQIPLHDGAEIIQDGLRSMGYDGIQHIGGGRVKSEGIKHKVFIAFDPEQIKSATGNNGNFDTNNPDIRFKTIDENRNYLIGISTDSLREKVKSITDQWKNSPKANIVETPSDLPFAAPNDARGAYYNGEIYLVASNIHSEHDAEIVLFHEALGHAGLRGAFGESLTPSLRKLAIDNLSIAKAAAEWRTKNKGIRGKRSEDQWLTTSVEEVLANIAESGKPIKGFDQFLSKVQSALRAVGLHSVADWVGKHTNAEVARLLTGARKYIISGNKSHVLAGEEAKAYSFDPSADKSAEIALDEIAKIGDAFAYPKSESNTVEGITADIDSSINVRKLTNIPGETRYEFSMPDGSTARMMVRPFNKYGKSIYGYELDANNEMTGQVDERPGKFPEEAHGKGDVWIDVSLLKEGKGYGAKLYQIAGNYAYNTGQVFIGDPAGISREALLRRPEQMLSSALKFGTTEHIAPHPIQIKGDKKNGIAPLDWVYGDHIGNIQKLIDATLQNIDNVGGIGGIEYDKRSGEFIDGTGASVTRRDLFDLAKVGLARTAKAGGGTLARYAFLKSILPAHGSGKQTGRQSGALLVQLSNKLRDHVSTLAQNGSADPESKRIFYSRGRDGGELTQAMEEIDKKIAAAKEKYDKNKTPLTEGNLLDLLRKKEALINNQNKPAQEAKQKQEDDYRDSHKAPTVEDGAQGNDLTKVYPDDIYSAKAAQYYGDGSQLDKTTIKTVQSWRGKPNAEVTIYRAVPKDAPDTINTGDWVGINLEYAENHGDGPLNGDYKIVSKKVKVSEIYTNGDSIQEWGYHPSNDDVKFSLASNATNDQEALSRVGTVTERADAIIKQSAATPAPIDSVVKAAVKISQIDKVTGGIYDGAGFILDRYTPESIKAGFVSDYGVPEAVIDRRTVLSAHINVQTRKIGKFVDQLSSLTRQESRVAYEWLNNKDPQALQYFENQLPPESVAVLSDIKKTIDDLSKEAISLGQLSQEAYDKNAFEYLRRSYVKHTFEQYKGNEKKRARAISILGDQYKGRGLSEIASMQQIENIDPAWWNRKLQDGKADKQLKGEKFIRLEKHAASGEGTIPLEGIGDRPKGKLQSVVYYPANETIPTKYAEWSQAGTFEVRDVKGSNVILWRDFTKQEREKMGEIDEARYAIANTLHSMVNDIETARYLEWINKKYGFAHPEQVPGKIVEAKELSLTTFGTVYKPGDWVQVPDTKVQGTDVKKYGALAGKYIPGPIWNDIRQIGQGSFKPFGETYSTIQRFWKTSKTALSPAVHTNNVMANFVMADWHDVSAGHIYKALRILLGAHDRDGTGAIGRAGNAAARLGIVDRDAAKEILARYQDSGGNIGTYASKELQNEQIQPLLDAIEKEMAANGESPNAQVGVMNALQFLRHGEISAAYQAAIGSKPSKAISNEAKNLIALYQSEDDVFRLAAWLKAKEDGDTDIQAGKKSRKSFLDYNINAPWVAALRSTAFPFVAFSYRAIPMLAEIAAKRPWKILKLAAIAGGLNALGYALSGGDEDDERRYLPEEKAGRVWGMVPKLIRLGWNDEHDQPVFLDIRRFIPVGDIADVDQGHSALPIPPSMMPGGPLMLLGEAFLNKSSFTGKSITLETDTNFEKLIKTGDYLYKAVAPNIALLPGTYGYENITNAGKGKTDAFGRELSVNQALLNSVGIKVGSYGTDTLRVNAGKKLQAELSEIDTNINSLSKEYSRKGLTYDEFIEKATKQQDKKKKIIEQFREK